MTGPLEGIHRQGLEPLPESEPDGNASRKNPQKKAVNSNNLRKIDSSLVKNYCLKRCGLAKLTFSRQHEKGTGGPLKAYPFEEMGLPSGRINWSYFFTRVSLFCAVKAQTPCDRIVPIPHIFPAAPGTFPGNNAGRSCGHCETTRF